MSTAPSTGPRFVVLEHEWDGVHWDFMLEHEGRLRTWALDAPIVPGALVPAPALPDHRLSYLTYEGPVARGRGEVRRVAAGTYEPLDWRPDRVRVRLSGTQLVGEVDLSRIASGLASFTGSTIWTFRLGKVD